MLNTPGRNARAVAECTLGLILSEVRNIARGHAALKAGRWTRDFLNRDVIPELNEKTVGLVGYGAVARLLAGYLHAMGSRIIAYDPFVSGDTAPAEMVDLDTLMRESDVISIHARLSAETHHLVGERQLRLMKPTAVLVNTARSGLVDEPALVRVLQERRIMGAALGRVRRRAVAARSPAGAIGQRHDRPAHCRQHDGRLPRQPETAGRPSAPHAARAAAPARDQRRPTATPRRREVGCEGGSLRVVALREPSPPEKTKNAGFTQRHTNLAARLSDASRFAAS